MSLRLFLAVPIPEGIADRLLTLEADVPGASWRAAEQYHLTLRFIGDVDEAIARDLDTELGRIIAAPFEIALSGVGSFGGREPSALWAGVSAPPDLARLVTPARPPSAIPASRPRAASTSRTSPSPTSMARSTTRSRTSSPTPPNSEPAHSSSTISACTPRARRRPAATTRKKRSIR